MGKKIKKNKTLSKIVIATFIAIFSLMSAFTGTIAWFTSNRTVTASVGSFSVQTPTGVAYTIYQLHHFTDKDGNYSDSAEEYVGYESPSTTAVFTEITFDELGVPEQTPNPVDISHLWPAHRLTYALLVDGAFTTFVLESWRETTLDTAKVDASHYIHLSWAINIYGGAYYVNRTTSSQNELDNILTDLSTGYNTFYADEIDDQNTDVVDVFTFSEAGNNDPEGSITVADTVFGTSGANKRTIIYFSIEFSNDSDTFYKYNSATNYYAKNVLGNSNCYKGLALNDLVFKIS